MPDSHRGTKIGERIAWLVSRSIVATHNALVGTKHKLAMAVFHSMSDMISEEAMRILGPQLETMLSGLPDDSPMRGHIEFLAHEKGQLNALAGTSLAASGILSSVALIMNNVLAPSVRAALGADPQYDPDIGTLAQFAANGLYSPDQAITSIIQQGYREQWATLLIDAARNYPDVGQLFDMLRRGIIDDSLFTQWAQRAGMPEDVYSRIIKLATVPVSPADAALAVLRGEMTEAEGRDIAAASGLTAASFDTLLANTGEPLGLMQLLEAKRRGFIDDATLKKGILQSRVRDEWIPTAEKLAYSPMSVSDAVNATVQDQLSFADADTIAQQNGLEPGAFQTLVNTAGEPLSRGEMMQLYNRGKVTQDQVIQAFRESRMKNKYNELAFDLHERLLEPRELADAVQLGTATLDQAIANAMAYGYSKQDATILVSQGSARKLETYKNKVVTSIESLYEDGGIDNTTAASAIKGLGYTEQEASFILEAADMRRTTRQMQQVISAVRSKFLARHITDTQVTSILTTAGVPQAQIAFLLSEWQTEQQAFTRELTPAQVVKAVGTDLISSDEGMTRLVAMGYSEEDAGLLLQGA